MNDFRTFLYWKIKIMTNNKRNFWFERNFRTKKWFFFFLNVNFYKGKSYKMIFFIFSPLKFCQGLHLKIRTVDIVFSSNRIFHGLQKLNSEVFFVLLRLELGSGHNYWKRGRRSIRSVSSYFWNNIFHEIVCSDFSRR